MDGNNVPVEHNSHSGAGRSGNARRRDAAWLIAVGIVLLVFPTIGKIVALIVGIALIVAGLIKLLKRR